MNKLSKFIDNNNTITFQILKIIKRYQDLLIIKIEFVHKHFNCKYKFNKLYSLTSSQSYII